MNNNFDAFVVGESLSVVYNNKAILKNLDIKLNLLNKKKSVDFVPSNVEKTDKIKVTFRRNPELPFYIGDVESVVLHIKPIGEVAVFSLDVKFSNIPRCYEYAFRCDESIEINFEYGQLQKGEVHHYLKDPFWLETAFSKAETENGEIVSSSIEFSDNHMHIMPLINKSGVARLRKNGAVINIGKHNVCSYSDVMFSLSLADDAYSAIEKTFKALKENDYIAVSLKEERELPDMFNYFGWCTWDACYHNVSSDLLYKKLEEFKEKGIKLNWLLIDDGWSQYTKENDERPGELLSFEEDREKFPEGLKNCIKRIKEEYGVKYVGVWHAFTGYWKGISKKSEIAKEHKDAVTEIHSGRLMPAFSEDGAYLFWNSWHKYLKEQGVDFVKVDTQGSFNFKFISENIGVFDGLKNQYDALEKSVFENFDGRIINCMGMDMQNCLTRGKTCVNRNSGDFFPKLENGFISHCIKNVYNTPLHSMLNCCDFDMWWSKHETAMQSAVLRAVSGGPVYTSDELNNSDSQFIKPICDENGRIYELSDFAKPTYDCYYVDCVKENKPLKIYNKKDDKIVVAIYGVSECVAEGDFKLSDVLASGEYVCEEYFSGEMILLNDENAINIKVDKNECKLYNIYPVDENGNAHLGRKDKFVGIATETVREIKASDI